jgi:chloramphenicol 3-O phosphotransferase
MPSSHTRQEEDRHTSGTVIVLNGPSVAGKSSIQKALQAALAEPYLAMGIDSILVGMMPPRYFTEGAPDRDQVIYAEASTDAGGAPLFTLHFGPKGRRIVRGMHRAIAAFARQGNGVIVDHILYERAWLADLAKSLRPVTAYFIGIRTPLEVLEERERARGTSPPGHARSHYLTVHAGAIYDLELDTSRASPEACAAAILEHVRAHEHPTAFQRLRERAGLG